MEFLDEDNNSRDIMIDGQREMVVDQFHFFACKWTTTKSAMSILFRFLVQISPYQMMLRLSSLTRWLRRRGCVMRRLHLIEGHHGINPHTLYCDHIIHQTSEYCQK